MNVGKIIATIREAWQKNNTKKKKIEKDLTQSEYDDWMISKNKK